MPGQLICAVKDGELEGCDVRGERAEVSLPCWSTGKRVQPQCGAMVEWWVDGFEEEWAGEMGKVLLLTRKGESRDRE